MPDDAEPIHGPAPNADGAALAPALAGDRRLTPARADLIAVHLRGSPLAARFPEARAAEAQPWQIGVSVADLWEEQGRANRASQLLFGERIDIYEIRDGMAWGQARPDGYVGYLDAAVLAPPGPAPTHRVAVPLSHLYPAPDMKRPALHPLPCGAALHVASERNGFAETPQGWVPARHLAEHSARAADPVTVAETFLHLSYLWGGRSALGLDCSALVQLALQACGVAALRDSDMQLAALGRALPAQTPLRRGDLVFWRGHVGWMQSATELLHANAHHMLVASEPLSTACARISAAGGGEITARLRL
ncbi:MAG: NlpC/P60 family protein [Pseudomonadota bacterium]